MNKVKLIYLNWKACYPKHQKAMFAIASVVLLSILYIGYQQIPNKKMPIINQQIVVESSRARYSSLPQEVEAIGTVVAPQVILMPEVAGQIKHVFFQDGAYVEKGTLLFQLNDDVYKAKYESAKASLHFSETSFKRLDLLAKEGVIARQNRDQAEAELKQKRATAQEQEVMLNKMQIRAPFSGVVGKTSVHPGDYVSVGQEIVALTEIKNLRVEYNVPEKFLPKIHLGQVLSFRSNVYPQSVFEAEVSYISPTVNAINRAIEIYAHVQQPSQPLASGMFVKIIQPLGEQQAITIPARSLVPTIEGQQVYKIVAGKAQAVQVIVGQRYQDQVQILEGIKEGDCVITDGQLKVKNGMAVKSKEQKECS